MSKTSQKIALGAVFAAVGGYIAGILTAPKSGKETRKDLKSAATEAESQLKKLHTELSQLLGQAKDMRGKLSGKAKIEYDDLLSKSKLAKQKTREVLSALHEGDAENKDLQKAISDSTKAIGHLKAYVKKPARHREV